MWSFSLVSITDPSGSQPKTPTVLFILSKLLEVQVLQAYKLTCVILEKYDQKRAKFNPNAK